MVPRTYKMVCARASILLRGACVGHWLRGGVRSDALLLRKNDGSAAAGREKTRRIAPGLPKSEHEFLRDFAHEGGTDGMRVARALPLEPRDDPRASSRRPACSQGHRSYQPPGGLVLAG